MFVIDIIKGIIIGVSNCIPGFSGGTMAVILNSYEKMVGAISIMNKSPLKAIKQIWALLAGMALGIMLTAFLITFVLLRFPFQTILFSVGLVLGSIPKTISSVRNNVNNCGKVVNYLSFIVGFMIIVLMPLIDANNAIAEMNAAVYALIFVAGIVSAAGMIIPGVSGTLIMMIFGLYMLIMEDIKSLVRCVFELNFNGMGTIILILIIFGIGCIIGIVCMSKIIKKALAKYPRTSYIFILGLLIASPFSIIYSTVTDSTYVIDYSNLWTYVLGVVFLLIGVVIAYIMGNTDKKKINTKNE